MMKKWILTPFLTFWIMFTRRKLGNVIASGYKIIVLLENWSRVLLTLSNRNMYLKLKSLKIYRIISISYILPLNKMWSYTITIMVCLNFDILFWFSFCFLYFLWFDFQFCFLKQWKDTWLQSHEVSHDMRS